MNLVEQFLNEGKTNEISQNTKEWHEWRSRHIGASDVPAIMGTSDFSNPHKYWMEKTGQSKKFEGNWATMQGQIFEPTILALYTQRTGNVTTSKVAEFPAWPVLSASLDGFVDDANIVVEVKKVSKDKHKQALSGIVPETYRDQVQAQLLVTGAEQAHYVSYNDGFGDEESLAIVTVYPDEKRQKEILIASVDMWDRIAKGVPPEGIIVQDELLPLIAQRDGILSDIEMLQEQVDALTEEIKKSMKGEKVVCKNYTLGWTTRKGSIDYSKIEALKQIDLEQYRKPDVRIFSIKNKESKNGKEN